MTTELKINDIYPHTLFFAPFYRRLRNVEIALDPTAAEMLEKFNEKDFDYITNGMYPTYKLAIAIPKLNFTNKYIPFRKLSGILSMFTGKVSTIYAYLLREYENKNILASSPHIWYKNEEHGEYGTMFMADKVSPAPEKMLQTVKTKEEETWKKTISWGETVDTIYAHNIYWLLIDNYFLNIDLFIQKITSETEEEHISEPLFNVFKETLNESFIQVLNPLIKKDTRIIGLGKYKKKQYDFKRSYLLKTTMVGMNKFGVIKENGKWYEPDSILVLTHARKSKLQGVEIRLAALEENEITDL